MFDDMLAEAILSLTGDELYMVTARYVDGCTETQIAQELTELRGVLINRNQVHRRLLNALAKMRRIMEDGSRGAA